MDDFGSPLGTNNSTPPSRENDIELSMGEERRGNLLFGLLGGVLAAIIGAIVWAVVAVTTGYQIGLLAIGVGFLVGMSIRFFGRGHHQAFGILGALLALAGCVFGNVFSIYGLLAKEFSLPLFEVISKLGFTNTLEFFKKSFQFMDILFYAIAVYEGFKFSNTRNN